MNFYVYPEQPKERRLLWGDYFAEITNNESHIEKSENSSAKELEEYVKIPLLKRTNCLLDWLRKNKKIFPRVSDLGKCYLQLKLGLGSLFCQGRF